MLLFSSLICSFFCSVTFASTDSFYNDSFSQCHCVRRSQSVLFPVSLMLFSMFISYAWLKISGQNEQFASIAQCPDWNWSSLTWPPIEWLRGFIFPWIEQTGREADHIPPSFSRLRMRGFMSSLSSLHGYSQLYIYWVQIEQWTLEKLLGALVGCER